MVSRSAEGASMEEFAFRLRAAIDTVKSETYLLVCRREPGFIIGTFGDETISGIRAVPRDVVGGLANPTFSTGIRCGSKTAGRILGARMGGGAIGRGPKGLGGSRVLEVCRH